MAEFVLLDELLKIAQSQVRELRDGASPTDLQRVAKTVMDLLTMREKHAPPPPKTPEEQLEAVEAWYSSLTPEMQKDLITRLCHRSNYEMPTSLKDPELNTRSSLTAGPKASNTASTEVPTPTKPTENGPDKQ